MLRPSFIMTPIPIGLFRRLWWFIDRIIIHPIIGLVQFCLRPAAARQFGIDILNFSCILIT